MKWYIDGANTPISWIVPLCSYASAPHTATKATQNLQMGLACKVVPAPFSHCIPAWSSSVTLHHRPFPKSLGPAPLPKT